MPLSPDQQRRYLRQTALPEVGEEGQQMLLSARVLVVGAGGLGCPVLTYLVAAGVGTLGIADDDRVELSNLPRQPLYETADVGRLKTEAAKDRLQELNPEPTLHVFAERLEAQSAAALMEHYDIVVDCTDNFATRFALADASHKAGKPFISGAVQGWDGYISTFMPYQDGNHPCYHCWVAQDAPEGKSCQTTGVLGPAAGVIGSLQAQEVLKILLGVGEPLSGTVLHYDAKLNRFQSLKLARKTNCAACGTRGS